MKGGWGVITPWVILGGGWINLSVTGTGDPAKGDPGGEAPRPAPHPPHLLGDLSVTGNGDLPLATQRRVETSLLIDRPSPSLERIYQLGLWLAIFFPIFHRLPPNKFLRFRRTFHQFRSGWLCYFCYSCGSHKVG